MTSVPIDACGIAYADAIDEPPVIGERIRPPHRHQHAIAGVLKRKMEMRRKAA